MLQSLKKIFIADPVIQACIILTHNQAKIGPKRIFGEVLVNGFYLLVAPYHAAKFQTNPLC